MDALVAKNRGVLIRDLLIFQLKLVLDGIADIAIVQLSIGAVIIDLIFARRGRTPIFYKVLVLAERIDLWLNLYGAASKAANDENGLFGVSRAGSNSLLGKLEMLVKRVRGDFDPPLARQEARP